MLLPNAACTDSHIAEKSIVASLLRSSRHLDRNPTNERLAA
jgi:hypothetical protein